MLGLGLAMTTKTQNDSVSNKLDYFFSHIKETLKLPRALAHFILFYFAWTPFPRGPQV